MKLPIQLRNITGTYLNHLNEDCLRRIFSEKSLTLTDLNALAQTCQLFKQIVPTVFPKRLAVYCSSNVCYSLSTEGRPRYEEKIVYSVEKILKQSGSRLVALLVHDGTIESINLIAKHRVVGNLKELYIKATNINETIAVALKPIVQQLQLLSISSGTIECSTNFLANCDSLVELRIATHPKSTEIMENNFSKLQRFTCFNCILVDLQLDMLNFFKRHPSLKCVNLFFYKYISFNLNGFLREFGTICKELEELELRWYHLTMLRQPDLTNFPNLKKLRCPAFGNIIEDIVRPLTKLEELDLIDFVLSEKEFYKIVKLVNGRPNALTLKCEISFSQSSESYLRICNENSMVKLIS